MKEKNLRNVKECVMVQYLCNTLAGKMVCICHIQKIHIYLVCACKQLI